MNTVIDNILKESLQQDFSTSSGRQFLSDAFVALSFSDMGIAKAMLRSTGIDQIVKDAELVVTTRLKNRKFEFFWELGTLQLINSDQSLSHTPLRPYSHFLSAYDLDLSTIEGIVSAGFIAQPETFKALQLAAAV